MSSPEKPSEIPRINSLTIKQRRDLITEHGNDLSFSKTYKGTEKQNIELQEFLAKNSTFRDAWRQELNRLTDDTIIEKKVVIRESQDHLRGILERKPDFPEQSADTFLAQHDMTLEQAPAGMRNNNPFNIKWTNSDFQKNILVDGYHPSKNKDQGNKQVVFGSPEAGMASGIRLILHRYHNNNLHTIRKIIADTSIGWTQDGTAGNKLGNNAAREIAERMGVTIDTDINPNNRELFTSFLKELLFQEHGESSQAYISMIPSVLTHTIVA